MLAAAFQGKTLPVFSSLHLYKYIDASVEDLFQILIE